MFAHGGIFNEKPAKANSKAPTLPYVDKQLLIFTSPSPAPRTSGYKNYQDDDEAMPTSSDTKSDEREAVDFIPNDQYNQKEEYSAKEPEARLQLKSSWQSIGDIQGLKFARIKRKTKTCTNQVLQVDESTCSQEERTTTGDTIAIPTPVTIDSLIMAVDEIVRKEKYDMVK